MDYRILDVTGAGDAQVLQCAACESGFGLARLPNGTVLCDECLPVAQDIEANPTLTLAGTLTHEGRTLTLKEPLQFTLTFRVDEGSWWTQAVALPTSEAACIALGIFDDGRPPHRGAQAWGIDEVRGAILEMILNNYESNDESDLEDEDSDVQAWILARRTAWLRYAEDPITQAPPPPLG